MAGIKEKLRDSLSMSKLDASTLLETKLDTDFSMHATKCVVGKTYSQPRSRHSKLLSIHEMQREQKNINGHGSVQRFFRVNSEGRPTSIESDKNSVDSAVGELCEYDVFDSPATLVRSLSRKIRKMTITTETDSWTAKPTSRSKPCSPVLRQRPYGFEHSTPLTIPGERSFSMCTASNSDNSDNSYGCSPADNWRPTIKQKTAQNSFDNFHTMEERTRQRLIHLTRKDLHCPMLENSKLKSGSIDSVLGRQMATKLANRHMRKESAHPGDCMGVMSTSPGSAPVSQKPSTAGIRLPPLKTPTGV